MRAAAEVDELALAIEAQHAVLVQLFVDMLDLEGLPQVGDELAGLVDRQREPLERLGVLEDPGHLGLDGREVVFREAYARAPRRRNKSRWPWSAQTRAGRRDKAA